MRRDYFQPVRRIVSLLLNSAAWVAVFFVLRAILPAYEESALLLTWFAVVYWLLVVMGTVLAALNLYARTFAVLTVDDKEVVYQWGWISRHVKTVPARKIRACTCHQTWMQRLFGVVSISITTSGDVSEIYFSDMGTDSGADAYRKINQLAAGVWEDEEE